MHSPTKVAIQGDKASFHEIAALDYYSEPIELLYCRSFDDVFTLLQNGDAHKAFVAVSNSRHGEIDEVTRLIDTHQPHFEGEYDLPIQQHLIGLPGADISSVTKVISHPVALSQCSHYVESHLRHAIASDYHDTSAAVEYVKELADPSVVAIGSEASARLHRLKILQPNIQDDINNMTTFGSFTRGTFNKAKFLR